MRRKTSRALDSQRGTALIAVLAIAAVLIPLGTLVTMQCQTDFLITHNLRHEMEAFYVAEAGLQTALAEIGPDMTFDDLAFGPDHVAGTSDDDVFPFSRPPGPYPGPPFEYDIRLESAGSGKLRIRSTGTGRQGAHKVVGAFLSRSPNPSTPAAFYAGNGSAGLDLGCGGFTLSGFDHSVNGDGGNAPAVAAVAYAGDPGSTPASPGRVPAEQLLGAGSPALAPSRFDLPRHLAQAANYPGAAVFNSLTDSSGVQLGSPSSPQLSVVTGDLDVAESLSGYGVLIVQGTWHVRGTMSFRGLVLCTGGIVFESSSDVDVLGAVWCQSNLDPRLQMLGRGTLGYASAALAAVDRSFPGILDHAIAVGGWFEEL